MGRVLALVIVLAGCGRLAFEERTDAVAPDALAVCHSGTFSAPVRLTTLASTGADWGASLSADARTLYFSSDRAGVEEIYVSVLDDTTGWQAPTRLDELVTGSGNEGNPGISSDGLELYWGQSIAAVGGIRRATRATKTDAWMSPSLVIADDPTQFASEGPDLSGDGQTLYFSAFRPSNNAAIFRAQRNGSGFTPPEPLVEIDGPRDDGWPSVTADELEMYFTSYADTTIVTSQIRRAVRTSRSDPWTDAGAVMELDDPTRYDNDAAISKLGTTIVFASDRGPAGFDLYTATRSCD